MALPLVGLLFVQSNRPRHASTDPPLVAAARPRQGVLVLGGQCVGAPVEGCADRGEVPDADRQLRRSDPPSWLATAEAG